MCPLVQEFLSEGPKVRRSRGYLDLGTCRLRKMGAPRTIADDPMIDGLAPDVALRAQDVNRGRDGAGDRQAAEVPQSNLASKRVARSVFGCHFKDRRIPFPPSVELISRR